MSDPIELVGRAVDEEHPDWSASTRRRFVVQAGAALGSAGLLAAVPTVASAHNLRHRDRQNSTETILTVAASAEVLATIVNTIGWERGLGGDAVTQRNIKTAAREELVHYQALVSLGGTPVTKRIWVPDSVFANRTNLLNTLQVGDQIFINAYLVATEAFGRRGMGNLAMVAAQIMGVEAVHRALARQSLGLLGNDRVFMKEGAVETAPGAPNKGQGGFEHILDAVGQLQGAGFGFGAQGATPGAFYEFDEVSKRTPTDPDLNTFSPDIDK